MTTLGTGIGAAMIYDLIPNAELHLRLMVRC
jgi:hypothetical protein